MLCSKYVMKPLKWTLAIYMYLYRIGTVTQETGYRLNVGQDNRNVSSLTGKLTDLPQNGSVESGSQGGKEAGRQGSMEASCMLSRREVYRWTWLRMRQLSSLYRVNRPDEVMVSRQRSRLHAMSLMAKLVDKLAHNIQGV